jgi:hypothetical protein
MEGNLDMLILPLSPQKNIHAESALPSTAGVSEMRWRVRFVPILLQKSKIGRHRKSRES